VESSFWCFDALFQPQDHPARELADTFYMKNPAKTVLPKKIVPKVRSAHENGTAGSSGWGYKWSEDVSRRPVLRTHTTAVSARRRSELTPPAKVFCVDRAFRNETLDYKHLMEFHQVEGIVVSEDVTFNHLLGYLKEFYQRLGFDKVRFRPAYFPYTEMSVEPEVWMPSRKSWIELGGAGMFRPEVTEPLGIECPVLAWGLGLERPAMLALEMDDMRTFYRNDADWLADAPGVF
jgi:phenylalanyl-tRNA synthetase alpha chain